MGLFVNEPTLLSQETVFAWHITGSTETFNNANNTVSFYNQVDLEKLLIAYR
ncbi:unnamed protein product, partial [Ceratitis capitata]